LSQAIFLRPE